MGLWCGASILNQWVILTAAHCLFGCRFKETNHTVTIGAGHEDIMEMTMVRTCIDAILHERFDKQFVEYDIAIAFVDTEIPLSDNIKKVLITDTFENKPLSGYVAGWGYADDDEDDTLHSCVQKIRPKRICSSIRYLGPGMFCAGGTGQNIPRTSPGDSGCALIYKTVYQIGVVSYRIDAYPGLMFYTNISYFYAWINENTKLLYCRNSANKIK